VQERQTKSPDARYQLCRSEPSKHVCINCDEAARAATLAAQKEERHQMLLRDIAQRETPEKYPVFIQGLGWLSFDMAWESLQSLRTAQEQQR
jgi:hypothetical protein